MLGALTSAPLVAMVLSKIACVCNQSKQGCFLFLALFPAAAPSLLRWLCRLVPVVPFRAWPTHTSTWLSPPRPVACSHRVITVGTAPRVSCCGVRTGIGVVLHTQTPARHATAHCQRVRCRCRVVRACPACLTLVLACPSSGPRGLTPLSSSWCQPPCKGVGGWLCVLRGLSARVNTRVVRCTLPDRCVVVGVCNRTYVVATGVTTRQETHA